MSTFLNTGHYERRVILRKGYRVIRKDRNANVEVESQLRYVKKLFTRITVRRHPLNWSDRLEILALELKKSNFIDPVLLILEEI